MWKNAGIATTVKDLKEILSAYPDDYTISAAGGDCYVLINKNEKSIVFDEKDYSDEWNSN